MTFEESLEFLNKYTWSSSKKGLDITEKLLQKLGDPHKKLKFVHVAGTNGKGSVCAMLESILRSAGYKTGFYSSPHVENIRERYRINGEMISEDEFSGLIEKMAGIVSDIDEAPSQYVIMTAAAFEFFYEKNCDIVVLEVGLGGTFDSTNVIDKPEVSVICNIGLDHTTQLGSTVEEIAAVKCGIIKPGAAVAVYENVASVMDVIYAKASESNSKLYSAADEKTDYEIALKGKYQKKNARLVSAIIKALRDKNWNIPEKAVEEGFKNVKWPARFQILREEPLFILDGGHNSQCAEAVVEALNEYIPDKRAVFLMGMHKDKDVEKTLDIICSKASKIICVSPDSVRALKPEELSEKVQKRGVLSVVIDEGPDMIRNALELAQNEKDAVVAFGSLYMAGDILKICKEF